MGVRRILAEAREAALFPRDFYRRMPDAEGWGGPAARLAFWSLAAGLVDVALSHLAGNRAAGDVVVDLLTLVLFPLLGVAAGFAAALALHGGWRLLGGKGGLKASWRAAASVAFVMPLIAVAEPLGSVILLPWLWLYALLALAGEGVHRLPKGRAWAVSGALALAHLAARLVS